MILLTMFGVVRSLALWGNVLLVLVVASWHPALANLGASNAYSQDPRWLVVVSICHGIRSSWFAAPIPLPMCQRTSTESTAAMGPTAEVGYDAENNAGLTGSVHLFWRSLGGASRLKVLVDVDAPAHPLPSPSRRHWNAWLWKRGQMMEL